MDLIVQITLGILQRQHDEFVRPSYYAWQQNKKFSRQYKMLIDGQVLGNMTLFRQFIPFIQITVNVTILATSFFLEEDQKNVVRENP